MIQSKSQFGEWRHFLWCFNNHKCRSGINYVLQNSTCFNAAKTSTIQWDLNGNFNKSKYPNSYITQLKSVHFSSKIKCLLFRRYFFFGRLNDTISILLWVINSNVYLLHQQMIIYMFDQTTHSLFYDIFLRLLYHVWVSFLFPN